MNAQMPVLNFTAKRWQVLFCVLLNLLAGVSASGQHPVKRVLLLYDEDKTLPGLAFLDQSLRSGFSARPNIEFFTESMNLSQFDDENYEHVLRDYYLNKYRDKKLDLVVAVMGPALHFLLAHGNTVFPGVPVIFCGADEADLKGVTLPPHVTGLLLQRSFAPTLDVALQLQPQTRNVFVVGGTSAFDRHLQAQARREFEPFAERVSFEYITDKSVEDILAAVSRLPPQSVILYITLFRDAAGRAYVPHDVASRISAAANAPVYVFMDQYLGRGVVGGHLYSTELLASSTAELGLRILNGESPSAFPVRTPSPMALLFDAKQLSRWNIDERRLPPDSTVRFREPSTWDRYGHYILFGGALLVVQSALIAGLLLHRTRRRRAEAELRHSFERIRHLGGRLLQAQETERAFFAREIHDDISQQIVALQFDLQRLKNRAGPKLFVESDETYARAAAVLKSLRELSHRLHPAHLRLIGLPGALKDLQRELSTNALSIIVSHEGVPDELPADVTLCFYRVAQEALSNAIKHSRATAVAVQLRGDSHSITMNINDNGVGFDVAGTQHGLGLVSMRERVEQIGGTLELRSDPERGTQLEICVPYGATSYGQGDSEGKLAG